MKRKLWTLLLALALVLSLCPVYAQAQETELPAAEETVAETEATEEVLVTEEPAEAAAPSTSTAEYLSNDKRISGRVTSEVRYYLDGTGTRIPVYGSKWYYFSLLEDSYGWVSVVCDSAKTDYTIMRSDGTYYSHFDTLGAGIYFLRVESEKNGAEYELTLKIRPVSKLKDYYGSSCPHNNGHYEVRSNGTCVTPGKKQWNCSDCGFTYLETFWGDHAAGEWTLVKEPNACAEAGLETSACTMCGEYMERKIPAAPHVLKEKTLVQAPGLTFSGRYSGKCVNCNGVNATVTIPMVENASDGFVMDEDVVHIESSAFSSTIGNFDYLTSITIPESVTSIGQNAFKGCTSLTEITIPESVTSIGFCAFSGCENLTRVTFETGNATIGKDVFENCPNLTEVHSPSLEAWFGLAFTIHESERYYPVLSGRGLYIGGELLTEAVIPEGITGIPAYAFFNYDSLTGITLSKSVTSIGEYAFAGCSNLNSVAMPGCVKEIEDYAFYSCSKLTSIFLPEGLICIGSYAFRGCNHLLSITIPKSVGVIGLYAFMDCSDLTRVYFMGDAPSTFDSFYNLGSKVIAYFPAGNSSWTLEAISNISRYMTWRSCYHWFDDYTPCDGVPEYCSNCGAGRAYAHTYESATCTTPRRCTGCGIEAGKTLGHISVVLEAKEPTCTQPGLSEGKHCKDCKEILVAQTVTAPALGHAFVDGACERCGQRNVTRIAGSNRISTALTTANKLKEVLGIEKFDTILVANAMNFPDALSGSYLAAAAKAPILLYAAGQSTVTDYIKANLSDGGTVYILGGESSVPESLVSALPGVNCERVSGSGRWATSLAIIAKADEILGTKPNKILICDGTGFADSLSASATGLPILLVNGKGTLRDDQKAYLESVRGAELYAIGGVNTITPDLLKELDAYDANGAERVYGSGRELTSAAVAKTFFPEARTATLASSLDFPDGLSGGPVAFAMNAPLLLTRENKEAAAKDYVNSKGITSGYIIGGEKAVSDTTAERVFGK